VRGLLIVDSAAAAPEGADALAIVTEWKEFRTPDVDAIRAALRTPLVCSWTQSLRPEDDGRIRPRISLHGQADCAHRAYLAALPKAERRGTAGVRIDQVENHRGLNSELD
jgi:hypothetical protein